MKSVFALAFVLAAPALSASAARASVDFSIEPATITAEGGGVYDFTEGGYSGGATVTGFFAGQDLNANGQISSFEGEVTDFGLSFSGNAIVPAFTIGALDYDGLVYQFGPTLGASTTTIDGYQEGIEASTSDRFFILGPGPAYLCDGIEICGGVMAVPEPETWALTILGFVGIAAAGASQRPRILGLAAPRRSGEMGAASSPVS